MCERPYQQSLGAGQAKLEIKKDPVRKRGGINKEDFEMLTARYEVPDALEDERHFTVSTESSPEITVREVLERVARRYQGQTGAWKV